MSCFSQGCDRKLEKSDLKTTGLVLAYSLKGYSPSWWKESDGRRSQRQLVTLCPQLGRRQVKAGPESVFHCFSLFL